MELTSSTWHLFSSVLVFLLGLVLVAAIARRFRCALLRAIALYVWHTVFCFVYMWFVIEYGGDATDYFLSAEFAEVVFAAGTSGVRSLTAVLVQGFDLSFLGASLVYNIFGAVGLLALDASLRTAAQGSTITARRVGLLLVLLPSVSFWSAGIGKDALSFMAASLALWAALDLGRRAVVMGTAVLVMLFVRPHIAGLLVLGLTLAAMLDARARLGKRVAIAGTALIASAAMLPFAMEYSMGEEASLDNVGEYIETRQGYNTEGGGGVDIQSMSVPEQLFTYMFRPALFEATNLTSLAAAFENLLLLFLAFVLVRSLIRRQGTLVHANWSFLWVYSLSTWLLLAMTTANLGIALRQKWMFLPMLIFIAIARLAPAIHRRDRLTRTAAPGHTEAPPR